MAGGVASCGPALNQFPFNNSYDRTVSYGKELANRTLSHLELDSLKFQQITSLAYDSLEVPMPKSQFKVSNGYCVDHDFFAPVLGDQKAYLKLLKLNNIAFLGFPADFSGEIGFCLHCTLNLSTRSWILSSLL